jgi:hypothetical protein
MRNTGEGEGIREKYDGKGGEGKGRESKKKG